MPLIYVQVKLANLIITVPQILASNLYANHAHKIKDSFVMGRFVYKIMNVWVKLVLTIFADHAVITVMAHNVLKTANVLPTPV